MLTDVMKELREEGKYQHQLFVCNYRKHTRILPIFHFALAAQQIVLRFV